MKKKFSLFLLLTVYSLLPALVFTLKNKQPILIEKENFTKFKNCEISGLKGAPAIPLKTYFFEIPLNKKIQSVQIIPSDFITSVLKKEIIPNPQQQPLMDKKFPKISKNKKYYEKIYPKEFLYNFGDGYSGNKHIGFVAYFTSQYCKKLIKTPQILKFNVVMEKCNHTDKSRANYVTAKIINSLNINTKTNIDTISYLLIYPESFENNYLPLLSWRKKQGLKVFTKTVEDIQADFTGNDLQEKIRNCIIDEKKSNNISFVTLGADINYIPIRYFFAFDCHYGASEIENDIPADMYYSCLDGNWDANQNGIFGEDDDEPDYFPDVFVSRITAKNELEVSKYVSRLITYEKGLCPNYETASGFSMDLWQNSNSINCQEYIYDHYFPQDYDISILSGNQATVENAVNLLNSNRNIFQHTGHANSQILALEEDYFNKSDCTLINNQFSGIFYSIGCWSSALDFDSIAENLLINEHSGFEGYIGNSRYGWGSPSSPGFGFSEFYQKKYFENLFHNDITILAEGNAMQKIPFIAYFNGVSVYKWCAYELNAIGDSYANIITHNPKILYFTLEKINRKLIINLTDKYGLPVSDVIANLNNKNYFSDESGNIEIESPFNGSINLYKKGFKNIIVDYEGENITHNFFTSTNNLQSPHEIYQGEHLKLKIKISNESAKNYNCTIQYKFDNNLISYNTTPLSFHLNPNSYFVINDTNLKLKSVVESEQILPSYKIPIKLMLKTTNDVILDSLIVPVIVKAPLVDIVSTNVDTLSDGCYLSFRVKNIGNGQFNNLNLKLKSDNLELLKDNFCYSYPVAPQELIDFQTKIVSNSNIEEMKLINYSTETISNNNIYKFKNILPLTDKPFEFYDNFENGEKWTFSKNWKRVNNFSVSGDSAISCRVDSSKTGVFIINSPTLNYIPEARISFNYRYRVYMYGFDSLILKIEHSGSADTLICLGSGGALDNSNETNNQYINGDWDNFDFVINDVINHKLNLGENFRISLVFRKESDADYIAPENGIFIDDIKYFSNKNYEQHFNDFGLKLFPNPAFKKISIKFKKERNMDSQLSIFNIKGQKVDEINFKGNTNLFGRSVWSLNHISSGVYIFRLKNAGKICYKKAIVIK
jgi:hypothetical protein